MAGEPAATTAAQPAIGPEQMKQLKAAVATTTKQYKEAASALESAERSGMPNLGELQARVAGFKQKADDARSALDAVIAQMKAATSEQQES